MLAYEQPEILRKEKEKHAAEPGFLKPSHMTISVSEVLSEGSVFGSHQRRSRPIVSCTVQTHSERRFLSQRTCSPNRDDGGKIGRGLEMSWLAQGCTVWWRRQRQKPGILISSPAICSFSRTTPFCCSNAYGVLTALKIIIYDLVFLTSGSFTYRHIPHWTQSPPGTVPPSRP